MARGGAGGGRGWGWTSPQCRGHAGGRQGAGGGSFCAEAPLPGANRLPDTEGAANYASLVHFADDGHTVCSLIQLLGNELLIELGDLRVAVARF